MALYSVQGAKWLLCNSKTDPITQRVMHSSAKKKKVCARLAHYCTIPVVVYDQIPIWRMKKWRADTSISTTLWTFSRDKNFKGCKRARDGTNSVEEGSSKTRTASRSRTIDQDCATIVDYVQMYRRRSPPASYYLAPFSLYGIPVRHTNIQTALKVRKIKKMLKFEKNYLRNTRLLFVVWFDFSQDSNSLRARKN